MNELDIVAKATANGFCVVAAVEVIKKIVEQYRKYKNATIKEMPGIISIILVILFSLVIPHIPEAAKNTIATMGLATFGYAAYVKMLKKE